ncbi:MAG TPA: ornithine--oxo-acid transaminase [Thermoleophilaceae bacterium]|jgi:ornithine--oxo-acid transaminase|nr:ornithine--oxo-acid transaminase [Thermoleophilaceae bacterium]
MAAATDTAQVEGRHTAPNYAPARFVAHRGEGSWVEDRAGRRVLDAIAGYSALNFGHRHPALVAAAEEQLRRLTLTSRAYANDRIGPFTAALARLVGRDLVLPMNTGAEAVETAIKLARRWGYMVKGVPRDEARIVVCANNFHGRTTTIVSFSDDPLARDGFGPATPGFVHVPYGDANALRSAVADTRVVAFLVEPVQGEAGVIPAPAGYLTEAAAICADADVLLVADEVQSGLGRTGRLLAVDHEGVRPDVLVLGKALGGGILALSAVAADEPLLAVLGAGRHGSTFGGNPLACAVGSAVVELLEDGAVLAAGRERAEQLEGGLLSIQRETGIGLRTAGLWAGIDVAPETGTGKDLCARLLERDVLTKDTHGQTIRLSPPLTSTAEDIDFLLAALRDSVRP